MLLAVPCARMAYKGGGRLKTRYGPQTLSLVRGRRRYVFFSMSAIRPLMEVNRADFQDHYRSAPRQFRGVFCPIRVRSHLATTCDANVGRFQGPGSEI